MSAQVSKKMASLQNEAKELREAAASSDAARQDLVLVEREIANLSRKSQLQKVLAPFAGRVVSVSVPVGANVKTGDSLVQIVRD